MSKALLLAFKSTDNKTCNLRISSPKTGITRAQAEAVMQVVIEKNIFRTSTGASLVSVAGVFTVETNKNEVLI